MAKSDRSPVRPVADAEPNQRDVPPNRVERIARASTAAAPLSRQAIEPAGFRQDAPIPVETARQDESSRAVANRSDAQRPYIPATATDEVSSTARPAPQPEQIARPQTVTHFTATDSNREGSREHSGNDRGGKKDERRSEGIATAGQRASGSERIADLRPASGQQVMHRIIESIEKMIQNRQDSRVQLTLDLERGEKLKILLKVAGNHMQTVFVTDSDGLRSAIREHWDQFQRQMQEKGMDAQQPQFANSENGQDSHGRRENPWEILDEDELAGTSMKMPGAASTSVKNTAAASAASHASRSALDRYA